MPPTSVPPAPHGSSMPPLPQSPPGSTHVPHNRWRWCVECRRHIHRLRCFHFSGRASRLRRSLSSGCNARCKADQSHPRIQRPAPCARNILHARRLLRCASGCRHAEHRRPHRSRRQSAAHSHRPRGRSHLRPQHQSQADRLGLARRLRRPPHAALLCAPN